VAVLGVENDKIFVNETDEIKTDLWDQYADFAIAKENEKKK